MSNILIIRYILSFLIYVFVQILFAKNLELFGVAFCFVYIHFLLTLPLTINPLALLTTGFVLGITIDSFYDTLGMHTFACVLIAYLRPFAVNLISSRNEILNLSVKDTGIQWFSIYTLSLIFVHHFLIFLLQQFNFDMFFYTFIKVIASSIFTYLAIIVIEYLIYTPVGGNVRK